MEYIPFESLPYYAQAASLAKSAGCVLVEMQVAKRAASYQVRAIIASADSAGRVGIDECAKVHRLLFDRMQAVLATQDITMEVSSPGLTRVIKNAAEFALFAGRAVRVWDERVRDWQAGTVVSADDQAVTLEEEGGRSIYQYRDIAKAKLVE